MRSLIAIAAVVAVATSISATPISKSTHRTVSIVIAKLAYTPIPPGLRVGDTIIWVNRDIFRHSVTAPGHFNLDLVAGASGRMTLGKAGVFPFTCKYHPGMKGVLKVNP
jgi:plastocyanin